MASASPSLCPLAVARVAPRETRLDARNGEVVAPLTAAINPEARRWFALAIGSLVVAGLLSLSVVLGRLPLLSGLIGDPLFFKRCLVVHVDLALVVWFYAFIAGLASVRAARPTGATGVLAFTLAVGGVAAMLGGALIRGAEPVLANYIPVIDHPVFLSGIGAFFLGTLLFLLETLGPGPESDHALIPADAAVGLQAAAVAFVLAGATWIATRAALPPGLDTWTRHEFSTWGMGHVLQVANTSAMLAVWLWLLARATGRPVLLRRRAMLWFTVLIAPHFAMPMLTARGALDPLYHTGATLLMRWGIFPVVLVIMGLGARHLWRARAGAPPLDSLAGAARAGFVASAALTLLGFALGACIRSSTTLVPAHYHAALGGVTVAFMTAAYLVCAAIRTHRRAGPASPSPLRPARHQLILFGIGQSVFALGFALGGAYGLGRKTYAAEQHVRSLGELIGLGVMGIGGLVATAAGLWFLTLVLREMRGWWRRPEVAPTFSPSAPP